MIRPDFSDERMNAASRAAFEAALSALCEGDTDNPPETIIRDLLSLWIGELIVAAAGFKRPGVDLHAICVQMIDIFIATNSEQLARISAAAEDADAPSP